MAISTRGEKGSRLLLSCAARRPLLGHGSGRSSHRVEDKGRQCEELVMGRWGS
jgi:hypothetical protein